MTVGTMADLVHACVTSTFSFHLINLLSLLYYRPYIMLTE